MSRINIKGEKYDMAFGVDHSTGAFVQLWIHPWSDQDGAVIKIDSFGVVVEDEQAHLLTDELKAFVARQAKRFADWRFSGRSGLPNIDQEVPIELARVAGGFPDITKQVYQVFD